MDAPAQWFFAVTMRVQSPKLRLFAIDFVVPAAAVEGLAANSFELLEEILDVLDLGLGVNAGDDAITELRELSLRFGIKGAGNVGHHGRKANDGPAGAQGHRLSCHGSAGAVRSGAACAALRDVGLAAGPPVQATDRRFAPGIPGAAPDATRLPIAARDGAGHLRGGRGGGLPGCVLFFESIPAGFRPEPVAIPRGAGRTGIG